MMVTYPYNLDVFRYKLIFQLPQSLDSNTVFGSKMVGIMEDVIGRVNPQLKDKLFIKEPLPAHHPAALHIGVSDHPAPFMLMRTYQHNLEPQQVAFVLTLFGDYHQYFPQIFDAFIEDKNRAADKEVSDIKLIKKYDLAAQETGKLKHSYQDIYNLTKDAAIKAINVKFHSPFIIMQNKKLITDFSFCNFYKNLHRRVALLSTVFGNSDEIIKEFDEDDLTAKINLNHLELYNKRIHRKPSEKKAYTKHGYSGRIGYNGDLKSFLPLLVMGQYSHIGSDTTFGLGNYSLEYYEF